MAGAVRRNKSAFAEALQRVSDFPLDVGEGGAIGRVKPVFDHNGTTAYFPGKAGTF